MRIGFAATAAIFMFGSSSAIAESTCADKDGGLGVSRVVEIDTSVGPLFGDMSVFNREDSFLGPKEVVLTFDDGPLPAVTKPILDTLDKFCTRATFFSVGRMALAFPDTAKDILKRGHALGGHTWSHANLKAIGFERAKEEIEKGLAAVALAAGEPVAPFFRFPYLNDTNPLLAHMQTRGVASFTVDVVSNDSYISSPQRLIDKTISDTVRRDGGILLFHDIKSVTAKALPEILQQLKDKGFKVVHMRAKAPFAPLPEYEATLKTAMEKTAKSSGQKPALIPMTAAMPQEVAVVTGALAAAEAETPVTAVTPTAKVRGPLPRHHVTGDGGQTSKPHIAAGEDEPKRTKSRNKKYRRSEAEPPTGLFTFFD